MSRILEIDTSDSVEVASVRAFTAFRRVGRVLDYDAAGSIEGKIYVRAEPAFVVVEWTADKNRTRIDISATSGDSLNRAADEAMYLFARTFKAVTPQDFVDPVTTQRKDAVRRWSIGIVVVLAVLAFFLFRFVAVKGH